MKIRNVAVGFRTSFWNGVVISMTIFLCSSVVLTEDAITGQNGEGLLKEQQTIEEEHAGQLTNDTDQSDGGISKRVYLADCYCMNNIIESNRQKDLWRRTTTVTYGPLGIFNKDPPFDELPVPDPPSDIAPSIILYNKYYPNGVCINNVRVNNTATYIVIHGFKSRGNKQWVVDLYAGLHRQDPTFNFVVVDWRRGASISSIPWRAYRQPASNTRLIGKILGQVIKDSALNPSNVHCIGHSLGAHTCGYASEWLGQQGAPFGRITGLDPASPSFKDQPITGRLDPSDATFVDVIHTDGSKLGIMKPIGHVDFYPNGGKDQPGCTFKRKKRNVITKFLSCNHDASRKYFVNSVSSNFTYLSSPCNMYDIRMNTCQEMNCTSYGQDLSGKCQRMGFYATKTPKGTFYTDTRKHTFAALRGGAYTISLHGDSLIVVLFSLIVMIYAS